MRATEQLLTDFVLEQIEAQPLPRRIELLHALGAETQHAGLKAACHAEADALEQIEARHRQLRLDFQRRAEG